MQHTQNSNPITLNRVTKLRSVQKREKIIAAGVLRAIFEVAFGIERGELFGDRGVDELIQTSAFPSMQTFLPPFSVMVANDANNLLLSCQSP